MTDFQYIATDVDGTMLDAKQQFNITALNDVLAQLDRQNIAWVIASGGSYRHLKQRFAPTPLINTFVSINGALVVKDNQVVFEKTHPLTLIDELIKAVNQLPIKPDAIFLTGWSHTWALPVISENPWPTGMQVAVFNDLSQVNDKIYNVNPYWLIDRATPDQIRDFAKTMMQRFPVYSTYSGFGCLDILPAGVNKATGLKQLMATGGILTMDNLVAFGDTSNDRQMLTEAGLGVAMKNSSPDILKLADRITKFDNNHDGVIREVRDIFNLK